MSTHLFVLFCIFFMFEHVYSSSCKTPLRRSSPIKHFYATNQQEVSRIAFSSCYEPENMYKVPYFWRDVRYNSRPDLWLWLGDNAYNDGEDMDKKVENIIFSQLLKQKFYREGNTMKLKMNLPTDCSVLQVKEIHQFLLWQAGMTMTLLEMKERKMVMEK